MIRDKILVAFNSAKIEKNSSLCLIASYPRQVLLQFNH